MQHPAKPTKATFQNVKTTKTKQLIKIIQQTVPSRVHTWGCALSRTLIMFLVSVINLHGDRDDSDV